MTGRFQGKTLADELARMDMIDIIRAAKSETVAKRDYSATYRAMYRDTEALRRKYPEYGQPLA